MRILCISGKARHGKDTLANLLKKYLEKKDKKVLIAHYGDLVKYVCSTFFGWDGNKDEEGRSLLQSVGTDIIRRKNPDYWVKFIVDMLNFFEDRWDYVIIPDCRFANEIEYLEYRGFDVTSIRIIRDNFESELNNEQLNHSSETALDNYTFDYVIKNNNTIDCLKVDSIKMCEVLKL